MTSDYYPTVLEAVGLKMPKQPPLDGISLMPLIRDEMKQRGRAIGFQSAGKATWVEDRYKLAISTRKKPSAGKVELYDLLADPAETKNLADSKPAIVKRMKIALEAWRASCRKSLAGVRP